MRRTKLRFPGGRTGDLSRALAELKGGTVLGINPPVRDFAWFDLWSKPVGLLNLLQFLRSAGNDVYLVDCLYEGRTKPLDFGRWKVARTPVEKPFPYKNIPRNYYRFGLDGAAFRRRLESLPQPDAVLVTAGMTYWYEGAFEAVRTAKEIFPDAPVVLGGAYARLCPEHALLSGADFIQTAPFLLSAAAPAMDLYDSPRYGVLTTSLGCPMNCAYCAARTLWPGFAQRPLEDVFSDLRAQMSIPTITDMAFYDDALLLNKERHFYPLCEHLREHFPAPALRLHTPNGLHVAQLDDTCCRTLYRTGFHTIRLSLEGTDDFTGEASSGKVTTEDYARAVASLRKAGYPPERVETYILAGLPGQTTESVRASIETAKRLGGRPKLAEFSPIPGTPFYAEALRRIPELATEPLLHNNSVYAQYVAKTVTPEELQELKDLTK
jgi:radical SAM superfamily enzyme YgiQ (UPF0313 family)